MQNFAKSLSMSLTNGNMIRSQFLATKNNTINIYFHLFLTFLTLFKVLYTKRHLNDFFWEIYIKTLKAIFKIKEPFDHS